MLSVSHHSVAWSALSLKQNVWSISISGTISCNNSSTFKFSMLLKIKLKIEKKKKHYSYNSILAVFLQPDTPGSNTWEQKLSQLNPEHNSQVFKASFPYQTWIHIFIYSNSPAPIYTHKFQILLKSIWCFLFRALGAMSWNKTPDEQTPVSNIPLCLQALICWRYAMSYNQRHKNGLTQVKLC